MWNCVPMVFKIVPTSSVQNRPCAMALMASIKYRLAENTMFFLFKNA